MIVWWWLIGAALLLDVILITAWHHPPTRRQVRPPQGRHGAFRLLRLYIIGAWLSTFVPTLVQYWFNGRSGFAGVGGSTEGLTGYASQLVVLFSVGLLAGAAIIALHYSITGTPRRAPGITVVLAIVPWLVMALLAVHFNDSTPKLALVYPLVMIALWRARPPLRVFACLGWGTAITAVISILLGYAQPAIATMVDAGFTDKLLFGGTQVLAGPFSHPNTLGGFLSLGLPTVFLIRNRFWRLLGVAAVTYAVFWSASRTSELAVVVVLAAALLSVLGKRASLRRQVSTLGILALAAVVCWVPLHTTTGLAYDYRGRVWLASLSRWSQSKLFGSGPDAYVNPGEFASQLGPFAFHGHNMLVDLLGVGGLVMVAVVAVLLWVASRRAIRLYATGQLFPLLVIAAFLTNGILEVATDYWTPGATSIIVWFSLGAVLFAAPSESADESLPGVVEHQHPVKVVGPPPSMWTQGGSGQGNARATRRHREGVRISPTAAPRRRARHGTG